MVRTQLTQFLGFAAVALVCAVALSLLPVSYPHPSQEESLKLVSLAPVLALGAVGVWLFALVRRQVPAPDVPALRRFGLPVLWGAGFGLVAVALDYAVGLSASLAAVLGVKDIHLAAPYSLLAYTAGGVAVESIFRFLPIGVLSFIIVKLFTRGHWPTRVFAAVAAVSCVIEPVTQVGILSTQPQAMVATAILVFAYGLVASWQLWHHGVAATLTMRLAFYAVWHVVLGPLVATPA
ncbi:MAG TPA: hypothetical protein PKD86_10280 [Gemmatales bacterium]|nr:hypothetical protein [Gemmatales bacterium]HMP59731.1 hypothetical protein [Gemmatales bacterium]